MSVVLDVVASTLQQRVKQYANLIENTNPVLRALKVGQYKRNKFLKEGVSIFKTWSGGTHIEIPVRYAAPSSVQFYEGWDQLQTEVNDASALARYDWRMAQIPVFFSGRELAINSGDPKIIDLIRYRIESAEQEFFNTLNRQLLENNPLPNQINSLLTFITENNTTGVVGGIDRATNAWWRNLVFTLHATNAGQSFDGKTGSLSSRIGPALSNILRIMARGDGGIDVILAGQTIYDAILEWVYSTRRSELRNEQLSADLGVEAIMFQGVPIIPIMGYDYAASTQIVNPYPNFAFLINSSKLEFRVHPERNFALSEKIKLQDRDAEGFRIYFMGNLVAHSLNHHALLRWIAS